MSINPLNVAPIGCGRIAGHLCRAIAEVEGVELAAVCDLKIEKAAAYAAENGVPTVRFPVGRKDIHRRFSRHD